MVRAADGRVTDEARPCLRDARARPQGPERAFLRGAGQGAGRRQAGGARRLDRALNDTDLSEGWVNDLVQRVNELGQETGIEVSGAGASPQARW